MNPSTRFAPGFRISAGDIVILAAGAVATALGTRISGVAAVLLGMPVLHFFLFCNVFRIGRLPELTWAAAYLATSPMILLGSFGMVATLLGGNLVFAAILIARETRKPSYHGIFWKTLNPGLETWWHRHHSTAA